MLDVNRDPTLLGKIAKTIGRKSKMRDLSELATAQQALEIHLTTGKAQLTPSLKQLLGKSDMNALIEESGGFKPFLKSVIDQFTKVKAKAGSKKETSIKVVTKYLRTLEQREREVSNLREINRDDSLDPIQANAIQLIRDGNSIILLGPPGSGKTHCALYTLDVLALKSGRDMVLYVAPTSELVLQAFANLIETFPQLSIGILSPLMVKIPKKPDILVGTPQEMWCYLAHEDEKVWSTAIFDEIHTLTNEDMGYADAVKNLLTTLSRFENRTLIALSATINAADIERLRSFLSDLTKIEDIASLTLSPSPVPTRHIRHDTSLTPESLFRIFKKLGHDGTLVFGRDDIVTWDLFESLLKWLEDQNDIYYGPLIRISEEVNGLIDKANGCSQEVARLEAICSSARSEKAGKELRQQGVNEIQLLTQAKMKIVNVLEKSIQRFKPTESEFIETASDTDVSVASIYGIRIEEGQALPLVAKTILSDILVYAQHEGGFPHIPDIGPYFSLVPLNRRIQHKDFEVFCHLTISRDPSGKETVRVQGDSEYEWAAVNTLVKFAEAEGVAVADVRDMVKVTVRAFRYGLALMMPSLPFVVTQTVRKYLNERRIPFIFATQEMAVGISYPLRNVVIVGDSEGGFKTSLLVQMAGRAGRRGFDTDGRIVYINIPPQDMSEIEHLPELLPPTETSPCVSVESVDNLVYDLAVIKPSETDAITMIAECLRHDIPATQLTTIQRFLIGGRDTVLLKDELRSACKTLEICRCILAAAQHPHWYIRTKEPNEAIKIERMWKLVRRANQMITRCCF